MHKIAKAAFLLLQCTNLLYCHFAHADEGMWPFNMIPIDQISENYGVTLDQDWIEHVQKSALRISDGGSGSFISPNGLVMTNHHVGLKAIQNQSTKDQDFIANGFYASSFDEELKCPSLWVDQLISMQDVTDEVNQGITDSMSSADKEKKRIAAIAEIKKKAEAETSLQPQVVTLFQGGQYYLYLYKRYTDVRLVMAPEEAIASLGGDIDNFEFPRYALDICFFRVYENDQPLPVEHYLKWSQTGPQPSEVLFVVGNPGSTQRMFTSPHLQFLYDVEFPLSLKWMKEKRASLIEFGKISKENKRIAGESMARVENSLKAYSGIYRDFTKLSVIDKKKEFEKNLYGNPEKFPPWVNIKKALQNATTFYPAFWVLEGGGSYYSKLFIWAKQLVRLSTELKKPQTVRLKEYADTELPALQINLFSTEPVYLSLEKELLLQSFKRMSSILGDNHPAVKIALNGMSPEDRVDDLLSHTKLMDVDYRKDLFDNPDKVKNSKDALILLATALDPYSREMRTKKDNELESVLNENYAEIAKRIFAKYGDSAYPDGTFTLRLSVGSMKGYKVADGFIDPMTTIGGAYAHAKAHNNEGLYKLPQSWASKEKAVKKDTPLNFVSTNDIIGGNSGSPIINANGELVGIIFDGNSYSLIWNLQYTDVQGRAISVHSQGIIEALKDIYNADDLVDEITNNDQ